MAHGFTPDRRASGVGEITPEYLRGMNVVGIIADLDNTLALPDDPAPTPEAAQWLSQMRAAGVPVVVVSNNSPPRAEAFCRPLGIPYVAKCAKPFGRGIRRAVDMLELPVEQIALIGDQLFTDVLAASYNRVKCILTEPLIAESGRFFRLKRALERMIDKNRRI